MLISTAMATTEMVLFLNSFSSLRHRIMKTYNNLYKRIVSFENLILAWQKARKGKTSKFLPGFYPAACCGNF